MIGWLYVIGSVGFLTVDLLEFFTFTTDKTLRFNISLSATGSLFYLIGSIGFLPNIYAATKYIGILGFLLGSIFIAVSQTWKLYRICTTTEGCDRISAGIVEGGAGVGGYGFLIGTIIYWKGPIAGDPYCTVTCPTYNAVLAFWTIGSFAFLIGGFSLFYRHAVMKIV